MLKKPDFAIAVLNAYIICYLVVVQIHLSSRLEHLMFIAAPFISIWMFYTVIYNTSHSAIKVNRKRAYQSHHEDF